MQDWQTIVTEYGPLVWRTAYRLLANHADAADCFQETFLAALELSRRQPVRNMSGLLVRLATTRAIDRLRQRGRQEHRQAEGLRRRADDRPHADPPTRSRPRNWSGNCERPSANCPRPGSQSVLPALLE